MAFTEFCCRSGGSNLNAGTRTGNSTEPGTAADFTYASGTWVASTRTFTPVSGNPSTDGVAAGDFGSVYVDASSVTGYVARVTSVTATTIVFSSSALSGTAPADGVATRTCKIGGAWKGPNGAEKFPFLFLVNTLTNAAGDRPRINLKNDATYSITAAITMNAGPTDVQGYTTAYGDGGRATIDGGTTGASYILMTTAGEIGIADLILQNNGATGNADGLVISGARNAALKIVVNNVRGNGFYLENYSYAAVECEAYGCNQSNTSLFGGFRVSNGTHLIRCFSHDNAGSNSVGFYTVGISHISKCVADSNGAQGFLQGNGGGSLTNSEAYNNGSDGYRATTSLSLYMGNCNFIKNGGYGVNIAASVNAHGLISNCGFGSGTQANTSGTTVLTGTSMVVLGSITYSADVTPWVDPANGDFRINLAAAKGAGRGTFTQTAASYAGTVGYPDIGAAQHLESGGAAGILVHPGLSGGMRG